MRRVRLAALFLALFVTGCAQLREPPPTSYPVAQRGVVFVSRGDTLESIAARYHVSIRAVIEANGLNPPYTLVPGQKLVLPVPDIYIVKPGDTLWGIAKQYGIELDALIRLNGIPQPYVIQVGQLLRLPGGVPGAASSNRTAAGPEGPQAPPPTAAPRPRIEAPPLPPVAPPTAADPSRSAPAATTVRPSVTTGAVPSKSGVETEALPPPGKKTATFRPAFVTGPMASPPATESRSAKSPTQAPAQTPPAAANTTSPPATLPPAAASKPAAPAPATTAAAAPPPVAIDPDKVTPPARSAARMAWPVDGRVLSGFGAKDGGLHNDGINIAAPAGTPVRAAENGVVVYSGNELRGFGNLVLVRHADDWVTAYAHLDDVRTERGRTIKRGETIGTVGQTGNVASPQLHFEVRRGSRPVDPLPHLEARPGG